MKLWGLFLVVSGRRDEAGTPDSDDGISRGNRDRGMESLGSADRFGSTSAAASVFKVDDIVPVDDGYVKPGGNRKPKFQPDRATPPQFYLPGSLTPADVTKWGSGCWKHCLNGYGGKCQLCGSTACRVAPHEFECRQFKQCTLNVPYVCKPGEDCNLIKIKWWQRCWTSPCTSQCWYKPSIGNQKKCDECCELACRADPKYVGNACFRCTLCKSRWGPDSWGKVDPESKWNGHQCWGRDVTKGTELIQLKFPLPESSEAIISDIIVANTQTNHQKPTTVDTADSGISQVVVGGFHTTGSKPNKITVDKNAKCMKVCNLAKKSTQMRDDAYEQAAKWNKCKECVCFVNPGGVNMEMCEAVDCHIACLAANKSGERCLQCTRCNSCPGVGREKDTMTHAVESIFSRQEGTGPTNEEGQALMMGERRGKRGVNTQFGYQQQASAEALKNIKKLKMFNVYEPVCKKCVKMGKQQSCRESCAAYKRNPQNHVAAGNCKQGKCTGKLCSACKKCIKNCHNIKTVALDALPANSKDKADIGKTSFENCYHTFGCANDCDASLKKVKGSLNSNIAKENREGEEFVGSLSTAEKIEWAMNYPFDSLKEARQLGYLVNGELNLDIARPKGQDRNISPNDFKRKEWWSNLPDARHRK